MKEVIDLAFQLANIRFRDPQLGLCQVADDGDDALFVAVPELVKFLDPVCFDAAYQEIDDRVWAGQ
jgi:hypothetical protein